MAEITGPQKRKDTYYALSSAAYSLNRRFQRYTESSIIENKATALADQILAADGVPVVDAKTFTVEEVVPILTNNDKTAVVVENITPGYKIQTPIENALSNPDNGIKDFKIKDSEVEYADYNPDRRYPNAESMAFENTLINGPLAHNMSATSLKTLSFERCRMERMTTYNPDLPVYGTLCSNAIAIAEKNPLKHLFMNEMSIMAGEPAKDTVPTDWSKLPVTLEYLSLAKTDVMNANFDGLMAALPKLKNLKVLDMGSCGLTDEHARKLVEVLEKTQISRVNVSGNRFSEGEKNRLEALPDKSVSAAWEYAHLDKERTIADIESDRPMAGYLKGIATKEDMFAQDMIFPAAKGGAFKDVLDAVKSRGEYFSEADYGRKDGEGRSLLDELVKTEQLPVVFEPQYWNDPKSMQAVWEKVPETHRSQLGGTDGKVAFQKRKNQVMASALKTVLTQRSKRAR